jgi:flagellar hook-basal body complex protein FliE
LYLDHCKDRLGEAKTMKFASLLKQALDSVDEANEYTQFRYLKFPLPKNNVYFTIEVMVDIMTYTVDDPEIAIRCRDKVTDEVIFLWSWDKFMDRIDMMADWYEDYLDDGIINRDRFADPWSNMEDKHILEQKADEEISLENKMNKIEENLKQIDSQVKVLSGERAKIVAEIKKKG